MMAIDEILRLLKGVRKSGRGWSAQCPAHDDRHPSLSINEGDDGKRLLRCHAGCSYQEIVSSLGFELPHRNTPKLRATQKPHSPSPSPLLAGADKELRPVRTDLPQILEQLQESLANSSVANAYLERRGIPIELAKDYGLGYAADGKWPHLDKNGRPIRQSSKGRIVFPHTDLEGNVISLYGRAVELDRAVSKNERHDHLPGNKAYFNASAMIREQGPLYVCEGPFDALSLIAAGFRRSVAIFGLQGWRTEWTSGIDQIVLALDNDSSGNSAVQRLGMGLSLGGCAVFYITADDLGGCNDVNEAWVKGKLAASELQKVSETSSAKSAEMPTLSSMVSAVTSSGGVVQSLSGSLRCELPTDAPQEAQDALAALKEQECDVVALLDAFDLLKRVRFRMPRLDDLSVVVAIPEAHFNDPEVKAAAKTVFGPDRQVVRLEDPEIVRRWVTGRKPLRSPARATLDTDEMDLRRG